LKGAQRVADKGTMCTASTSLRDWLRRRFAALDERDERMFRVPTR